MGPVQAVLNGLLKFPVFTGRASRSEFWWFAPVWAFATAFLTEKIIAADVVTNSIPHKTLLCLAISLPIWSATSRRLQDTDEPGSQVLWPLLWLSALPLLFVLPFSPLAAFFPFGTIIFTLIAIAVLAVCAIIPFVIMGPLIGQMILPSTPAPNHYGPNPNEVPT
ncbi:DUF805 domain-containing protein [uncultured Litoreibacter sp.]|uniref:DUF805 domain-containing protein n=1 Tax=uncultured Litoreibacter sp. TaxID=1392394 RepID=UPI00343791C2